MILGALTAGAVLAMGAAVGRRLWPGRRPMSGTEDAAREPPPREGSSDEGPMLEAATDVVAEDLREADRWLVVSGAGLGLRGVGALGVPLVAAAAAPLLTLCLVPVYQYAWREYRDDGTVGFTALVAATGTAVLFTGHLIAVGLDIAIFFGGRRAMLMSKRRAHETLAAALDDWRPTVTVLRDGREVEVPIEDVRRGDRVAIRPGQPVPVDGEIVAGEVEVDERVFTGEPRLVERTVGDAVMAASLTVRGRAVVRAERTGAETRAARLEGLVRDAESYEQGMSQRSADVVESTLAPTVAFGALTALLRGPMAGVAALWSNCIDLFWLSAPVAVLQTLRAASVGGILVKDGRSLDLLGRVDTVVFDKTGTLTLDHFTLCRLHPVGVSEDLLLARAAAAEKGYEHPIARAILEAAALRGIDVDGMSVSRPSLESGLGLRAVAGGQAVLLGSRRLLAGEGIELTDVQAARTAEAEALGNTVVHLALDGRYAGAFDLEPVVRPEARAIVETLRARGVDVMILSGDAEVPTRHLAEVLGIDTWFSGTLPEQKDARIAELIDAGRRVCFVGDGVNDALAMRRAHVSISMAGASAIAVDSAQIVLRDASLSHLGAVFDLGRWHDRGQARLLRASLAPTVVAAGGVILAGITIPQVLGIYAAGLAASLVIVHQQGRFVPQIVDDADAEPSGPAPA